VINDRYEAQIKHARQFSKKPWSQSASFFSQVCSSWPCSTEMPGCCTTAGRRILPVATAVVREGCACAQTLSGPAESVAGQSAGHVAHVPGR
jgi:hypothetical protein